MAEDAGREAGITDDIIRLSIGLEDSDDLIEDLSRGFDNAGVLRAEFNPILLFYGC